MTRATPSCFLILLCLSGCGWRHQSNSNCEWPHETPVSLELNNPTQQRHLSEDAQLAEDLAIRYADSRNGLHSGHFEGETEYAQSRELCMAALFDVIGNIHSVTQAEIRESLLRRRRSLDLVVILSFAVLYGLAAGAVARRVWQRFPSEEGWIAGIVVTLLASAVVSTGGLLMGEVWSGIAEVLRVGNSHLSYRANRIPWAQHRPALFLGGVVVFWLIAVFQCRKPSSKRTAASA